MMNKSVLTIVRLAFFSLMLVALVVLMILNIVENGIRTGTDKIQNIRSDQQLEKQLAAADESGCDMP